MRQATGRLGVVLLAGCGSPAQPAPPPPPPPTPPRVPTAIAIVSGDSQSTTIFQDLPEPIVVRASDSRGPIPDVVITFRPPGDASGDQLSSESAHTDANGLASTRWRMGRKGGVRYLNVFSGGAGDNVVAYVQGGPIETVVGASLPTIARAGLDSTGVFGTAVDQYGNVVSGHRFSFVVDSGGGTFISVDYRDTTITGYSELIGRFVLGPTARRNVGHVEIGGKRSPPIVVLGGAARLVPVAGDSQRARPGQTLPSLLAVQAVNGNGDALGAGIPVQFIGLTELGGVKYLDSILTDANGRATSTTHWNLELTPGWNTTVVQTDVEVTTRMYAESIVPKPEKIVVLSGNNQRGYIGNFIPIRPEVVVLDSSGAPMPDQPIRVEVMGTEGRTRLYGLHRSDSLGRARVGSWRLGNVGLNRIRVSTPGLPPAPVTLTATAEDVPTRDFAITVRFQGLVPTWLRSFVRSQMEEWEELIVGDLPDIRVTLGPTADGCNPAIDEVVDDLLIYFRVAPVDGPGRDLGTTTVCAYRPGTLLPTVSQVILDIDDVVDVDQAGILDAVLLHQVGHALGIGASWSLRPGLHDSERFRYWGDGAAQAASWAAWNTFGQWEPRDFVRTEEIGGIDRWPHWSRDALPDLMAGIVSTQSLMSILTAGALRDLGYQADDRQAFDLFLPAAAPRP